MRLDPGRAVLGISVAVLLSFAVGEKLIEYGAMPAFLGVVLTLAAGLVWASR